MKFVGLMVVLFFVAVPSFFITKGIEMALQQDRMLKTYLPVEAVVRSKSIEVKISHNSKGGASKHYLPVVNYEYKVGGRSYSNRQVTPLRESSGQSWAEGILRRYQVGKTAEAYYNPQNPAEAYLLHRHGFFPYFFILFPMVLIAIGIGLLRGYVIPSRPVPIPNPSQGDWYEIGCSSKIAVRRHAFTIAAGFWQGAGALAWGHYFYVGERPYDLSAWISTISYIAFGGIPIGYAIYYHLLGREVADARVFARRDHFALGDSITIHSEQTILIPHRFDLWRVGLVCDKTTHNGKSTLTQPCFEHWENVQTDHDTRAGEVLVGDLTFNIPPNCTATSAPNQMRYPRYTWKISVNAKIPGAPDYKTDFPIMVGQTRLEPQNA